MDKVYTEKQRFFNRWLNLLLAVLFILELYFLVQNIQELKTSVVIASVILVLLMVYILTVRLTLRIDKEGLQLNFFPFANPKRWSWEEIQTLKVIEYSIFDYGGWGYRIGRGGVAYTTKGRFGIQIILQNNKKILIGTQNPQQVKEFLNTYNTSKDDQTTD